VHVLAWTTALTVTFALGTIGWFFAAFGIGTSCDEALECTSSCTPCAAAHAWILAGIGQRHCRLNLAVLFGADWAERFRLAYQAEAGRAIDPWWTCTRLPPTAMSGAGSSQSRLPAALLSIPRA
jgi:hypothetical protein